ncbi:MAG: hypothetical protein KJI71_00815 [Patescibacteria group bacterium]|nr:hypothetical protein [Patescibacteria group bacterium]
MEMTYKYLKPESHYSDLYDRFTVEECRRIEKSLSKLEYKPKIKGNKKSKKKEIKVTINLAPIPLYAIKGERYFKKAETIKEWMERDRGRDEKLENTPPPQNISCPSCDSEMEVTMKDLRIELDESKNRVLFSFECPSCKKRKGIYENGEGWKPAPVMCPKCNNEVERDHKRKGNKITTIYKCSECGHKEKEVWDLDKKEPKEKLDPDFEKDRKRFCLSEKEGQEYVASKVKLEHISKMLDEWKEKQKNKELYDKVKKIKKLNIAGLKKLLTPTLDKGNYIKLEFSKPEIKKDIAIEFTVQDDKADRGKHDSRIQLQRIIKKNIENTNWRLMSEGVNYRLGILSGRLRGYDNKEDLIRLII